MHKSMFLWAACVLVVSRVAVAATCMQPKIMKTQFTPIGNVPVQKQDAIYFRAKITYSSAVPRPAATDFIVSGGQVTNVGGNAAPNATWFVVGYTMASNFWTNSTTVFTMKCKSCTSSACIATTAVNNPPACMQYPVDMAWSGEQGLITDRNSATVVLVCSEPVTGFCDPYLPGCVSVSGIDNTTLVSAQPIDTLGMFMQYQISWQAGFTGSASISMTCPITDASKQGLLHPVAPINFVVSDHVGVRSAGYEIMPNAAQQALLQPPSSPSGAFESAA